MPDSAEHCHESEKSHHDHGHSPRDGVRIDEQAEPGDRHEQQARDVGLDQVVVDLPREVDPQDDAGKGGLVIVGGVGALEDELRLKLVQGDVGVDVAALRHPGEVDLVRRVAEALVLDLTDLLVDGVSVEVHVAGDVVVDAGRVPHQAVGVDPEGGGLDLEGGIAEDFGLVNKDVGDPEGLDGLAVETDVVAVGTEIGANPLIVPEHPEGTFQGDELSLFIDLEDISQIQGNIYLK